MRYLILFFLLALTACDVPEKSGSTATAPEPILEQELVLYPKADGKPYFHSHKGKKGLSDLRIGKIVMKGDSNERRMVLEQGIDWKVFRKGALFLHMSSDKAISLPPYREVDFVSPTNFELASGEQIEMHHMHWTVGDSMVRSDDFVQIMSQEAIIQGNGVEALPDFTYFYVDSISSMIGLVGE